MTLRILINNSQLQLEARVTNTTPFFKGKILRLLEHLLPGFNLHIEIILVRGDDTDIPFIIDTGRVIGHVEVNNYLIPRHDDLSIQVTASIKGFVSISLVPEGNEEVIAPGGFIEFHYVIFAVQLKSKPSVMDVSLLYPLIGQESGVIFGIHDVVLVSLDFTLEPILQLNGIVR